MRLTGRTFAITAGAALGFVRSHRCCGVSLRRGWQTQRGIGDDPPGLDRSQLAFPGDPWGKGKAFRCKAADCGGEVQLYVRAKLGFCNCVTGIADDTDLEQMGDLAMIGGKAKPFGAGRRSPSVQCGAAAGPIVFAAAERKDRDLARLQSALRYGGGDGFGWTGSPASVEPAVLAFLNSESMLKWAEIALGL